MSKQQFVSRADSNWLVSVVKVNSNGICISKSTLRDKVVTAKTRNFPARGKSVFFIIFKWKA